MTFEVPPQVKVGLHDVGLLHLSLKKRPNILYGTAPSKNSNSNSLGLKTLFVQYRKSVLGQLTLIVNGL
jgi:hypothetical protein